MLFASEFGSNMGHLRQMLPLASELHRMGHEVVFVLRDVIGADALLRPLGFQYIQAPFWRSRTARDTTAPCSYSEILQLYGYRDGEGLLAVVNAWRQLYGLLNPQAVLCEYAPTALLAARCSAAPRFLYGDGFSLPPRLSPFPNFRRWEHVPQQRLEASDAIVLDTINWVLGKVGAQPLGRLQELLDVNEEFLCTFQELDHYADRPEAQYHGSVFTANEGAEAIWPAQGTKRVCVYLRPDMPSFQAIAEHFSGSEYCVLWIAPGVSEDIVRRFETPRFKFATAPVRLSDATRATDAAVLYAGHGTVSAMLLAGIPLALFPVHVEQALVAHNVVRMGAGLVAPPRADAGKIGVMLNGVLEQPRLRQKASAFAAKYARHDQAESIARIASRITGYCRS